MTVEEILIRLNETLQAEETSKRKAEIIEVIKKIENESLYSATIYDFLTLRSAAKLPYVDAYKIPAIRQAFLDSIKNPSLRSAKSDAFFDIVQLFAEKLDIEILKADQEFNQIINDLTYEQAERLFCGSEVEKLFEDKKYYDILMSKAETDERFYKTFSYSSFSIEDGKCKLISKHNEGNNKLTYLPAENQLAILKQLDENTDLSRFLINFNRYDKEVIKYIINSPKFVEQLITAQSQNEYGSPLIPGEYEADIIAKNLDFIKELSFQKKYNYIVKMENPEMQKYIIQKLNFIKHLTGQKDFGNFFDGIKDHAFLVECMCDKEVLEGLKNIHLRKIIPKLNVDNQTVLYNNPIFQQFIRTLVKYELIGVIALFDETIVSQVLPNINNVSISDLMTIFEVSKNHKYVKDVIDSIKEAEAEKEENLEDNLVSFMRFSIMTKETLKHLTTDEFEFFFERYNSIRELRNAISFFDAPYLKEPITATEQEIYNNIDFNRELTEEEREILAKHRQSIIFDKELKDSIEMLKTTDERCIKNFGYAILNLLSEEEQKLVLDRVTLDCLMNNIASCETVLNYCYDLYLENTNVFDNVTGEDKRYVAHSDIGLSEEGLNKLRTLFKKANNKTRGNLLEGILVYDPEIIAVIKEEVKQNPNSYGGDIYRKKLDEILSESEMETALRGISLNNLLIYYSEFAFNEKLSAVGDKILLERKNEILHELNSITFGIFSSVNPERIITRLINISNDKEEIINSLTPTLLISIYKPDSVVSRKEQNSLVVKRITENPSLLLTTPNDKTSELLNSLSQTDLRILIDKLTINDVVALFAKTKNKSLEEKIMQEFNNQPYFINNTELSLEEILSRLEEDNKISIYSSIDKQFEELEVPYGIKDKLKKSSYDEKLFLIYGVKQNIFNEEKYQLINELLQKDPFALNSLNIKLLEDDIFNISKSVIPKIYRYENLTVSYINILKDANQHSRILLTLVEYLNNTTHNMDVYAKKLDTIIKYLICVNDQNIERIDVRNLTIEELKELEEYILIDSTNYLVATTNMAFFSKNLERNNNITGSSFGEIEQKRIELLDSKMAQVTDIKEAKDILFQKYYKITLDQVHSVIRRYGQSIEDIKDIVNNPNLIELFNEINNIEQINDIDEIKKLYDDNLIKHNVEEYLYMFETFDKAYSSIVAKDIKGYQNGTETKVTFELDGEQKEINAIELTTDFDMLVHSTDAYGSMEMINDNYFDSWNYSEKTSNHGICTCFISNSNLGTAPVAGKGVMFGFTNLNANSITYMAPYDLVTQNDGIVTVSRRPPMFTNKKDLVDYTRHTHNELVLERRNVSTDSKFPVIQPDCIIIFEEMKPEIKANAIEAQEHFKQQGIELPIIYINRQKVVELEAKKVNEMLNIYDTQPDLRILAEIINKYETNICGLDFEATIKPDEIFNKERIYNTLLNTIDNILSTDNIEAAHQLITILAAEQYKFDLIQESVGERAHSFDLLDEKILEKLKLLKTKYNLEKNMNSNFTI